jgi:hypothetical protein
MLPLGKLIKSHIESLSIGRSAANASLSAITKSISSTEVPGAAASASEINKTVTEGTKMLKALSLKAKILAGITAVAAVGTVAVLVVILATGGKNNPPDVDDSTPDISTATPGETSDPRETSEPGNTSDPTDSSQTKTPSDASSPGGNELSVAEMDTFWLTNQGYRMSTIYPSPEDNAVASDDKFIRFVKEGDVFKFEYGLYQSSYWIGGEVIKAVTTGNFRYEFTLHIPATPGTEVDPARPERTETVYVHGVDHRINIKIESLGNGEWYSYEYGGETLEEAANNR